MKKRIISIVAAALMLGSCMTAFAAPATTAAAGDVTINSTNFPDSRFRQYVAKFDTNKNKKLSLTERKKVTSMRIGDRDIKSLKGIAHFAYIKTLNCADNDLKTLDLSKNKLLTALDCSDNDLYKIVLSANTSLVSLNCEDNELRTLDLRKNKSLVALNCSENDLKALDLSYNKSLKTLDASENDFGYLELKANTKLKSLNLRSQSIDMYPRRSGSKYIVDLKKIIPTKYLSRAVSFTSGSYNSKTGILTFTRVPEKCRFVFKTNTAKAGSYNMYVTLDLDD